MYDKKKGDPELLSTDPKTYPQVHAMGKPIGGLDILPKLLEDGDVAV